MPWWLLPLGIGVVAWLWPRDAEAHEREPPAGGPPAGGPPPPKTPVDMEDEEEEENGPPAPTVDMTPDQADALVRAVTPTRNIGLAQRTADKLQAAGYFDQADFLRDLAAAWAEEEAAEEA